MKILAFFNIFNFFIAFCISQTFSPYETRPRLMINEGHMMFHAGKDKNITFTAGKDSRGSIYFGNVDLRNLPSLGHVQLFQQQISSVQSNCDSVRGTVTLLASTLQNQQQTTRTMQTQITSLTLSRSRDDTKSLKRRLRKTENEFDKLKLLVNTNECVSNPCLNGGTCIDLVGKYLCLCQDQFTGPNCAIDVNECLLHQGTLSGCQNGGTCVNTQGSFTCTCPSNYFGFRCTERTDDCQSGSHSLCGPWGICISNPNKIPGQAGYRCVCDPGYQSNNSPINPQCVDVDECLTNPCYPRSTCINLPGTFHCGPCPPGYNGNGKQCWDIDECSENNGGCSINPRVQCINTIGSFHCGSCPPGYQGNGQICNQMNSCARNPCHSQATCIEMPGSPTPYRCLCPSDMVGNGIGAGGCQISTMSPCLSNPCLNGGSCQSYTPGRFTCHCTDNYLGTVCQTPSACMSNPCLSGGTCVSTVDSLSRSTYMCRCPRDRHGQNCELQEEGCNANFMNDTGSLVYPTNFFYKSLSTCEWIITGAFNKILNITFPLFDLENSARPGCPFDNLTLFDGPTSSAPVLGVYCSCKLCPKGPEPFILTSTNQMFIKFKSDLTIHHRGFTMNWTSINKVCGGRSSLNSGQITSPDYPRIYGRNFHCVWLFSNQQPTYHYKIELGAIKFKIDDANCTKDKIQVRDGQRLDSALLAEYCTSSPGSTFFSSLPYFSLYFQSSDYVSDQSNPMGGFIMTYTAIPMDRACGGVLNADQGTIQSPNFGKGSYFNELNCIWIIDGTILGSSIVELTFLEFDIRGSMLGLPFVNSPRSRYRPTVRGGRNKRSLLNLNSNWGSRRQSSYFRCSGDFVEIRDGNNDIAPLIGTYCGQTIPQPVASSSAKMYIRLYTDTVDNAKGFSANYKIKCGNVLQGRNGTFQSPNFPLRSPSAVLCEYIVKAPETYAILIKFTTVELGNTLPFNCTENYVEMQSKPDNAWHNRKFCFVPVGRVFSTSGGNFKIIFKSDGSEQNRGFQANFETSDVGCGGTYNGRYGTIQSPRNTDEYLHNMNCRWFIEVPLGFVVRLNFQTFVLEEHRTCSFDYVAVYESYTSENQTTGFLGRYCGEMRPPALVSTTNTMVVVFGTDSSISRSGFEATFEAVNSSIGCDKSLVDPQGFMINIGYPQPLTRSMECEYQIHVARGYSILLKIENLTLSCTEGFIEIRNGPSANSPAIGGLQQSKLCGDSPPDSIRSQGNMFYLKFKTLRITMNTQIIYRITYEQIAEGCGGTLNAINGALSSPQYPYSSTQPYDCSWKISVAEGNKISLIIGSFDSPLPLSVDCWPWGSRLEIRDGPYLTSRLIDRICHHKTTVGTFQSTLNYMTVRYVLHSVAAATGFLGHYSTVCNEIRLTQYNGRLESPGFPNNAHSERNCMWRIETTVGNLLRLHFTHFKIDDTTRQLDTQCRSSFIQFDQRQITAISNAALINSTNMTKFCNDSFIPSIVYSKSNFIEIQFKSPVTSPANHFALEWTTIGCGGTFTEDNGFFFAANSSGEVTANYRMCQWTVKAPIGKKVELTIQYLGIPETSNYNPCHYNKDTSLTPRSDGLFIFNGISNASGYAYLSLCNTINEENRVTVASTGNEMFILMNYMMARCKLKGDAVMMANYTFIDGGCGSVLNASKGQFTSPQYPYIYPPSIECVWLIKVQPGYTIQLSITAFDLGSNNRNCQDPPVTYEGYLWIYDGDISDVSPPLRRLCGNTLPENPNVVSTGNRMLIRFQGSSLDITPGSGINGFAANYSTACGGILTADANVNSLESVKTMTFAQCDWIIRAQNPGENVYLTVNFLAMRSVDSTDPEAGCATHYLEIYDGSEPLNETKLDQLCGSSAPPSFVSSGNSLYLRLKTPAWFWDAKRHFMVTYTSSASFCGGDYYSVQGAFNSPKFPAYYPPSSVCIWTINNNQGNRVRLEFSSFNLEQSDFCSEDFIEIREESWNGRLLGRYCGNRIPPVIEGYWKLWIKFYSDEDSNSNAGFQASYKLLFGGDVTGTSGVIASPWYEQRKQFNWAPAAVFGRFTPADVNQSQSQTRLEDQTNPMLAMSLDYPGEEAWWRITVPPESYIQITFEDFSIPTMWYLARRGRCWVLFQLEIYDGYCNYGNSAGELGCILSRTLCGVETPEPWTSLRNVASLRLTAKMNEETPKFILRWAAVPFYRVNRTTTARSNTTCGSTLTATSEIATLSSPGYPNGYDNNLDCTWSITHPKDYSVWIKLVNVDLEAHVNCQYDYLSIQQICGGEFELLGMPQRLTSPNYPNPYPASTKCTWIAKALIGRTIEVQFQDFQLEGSPNCMKDYLRVINGNEQNDPILGQYCGSTFPPIMQSTAHFLRVEFVSDISGSAPGFSMVINEKKIGCGVENQLLTEMSPEGILTSPRYPDLYQHSLDCQWVIQAPSGSRIQFDFDRDNFDIESGRNDICNFDSVEIRDGASMVAPLLGKYCGKTAPGSLYSTGSFLFVRMISDESVPKKGFRAFFKIAKCGGTVLIASTGFITSPNYPQPYSSNTKCEWLIIAPEGHYISFSFADLSLMSSPASNCSSDFVEIKDINSTGESFGRFCISDADTMVPRRTRAESMYVKFESDQHINTPGFKLEFNASEEVCGGRLSGTSGKVMTPAYPYPYPNKRLCQWTITTQPNSIIQFLFEDLDFPENTMGDCKYDGVRIYNGPDVNSPLINTYCGVNKTDQLIVSTSDSMTILFFSDVSISGRGFKGSYTTFIGAGCGGVILSEKNITKTPSKNKTMYCHWIIRQPFPSNSSVNIRFLNLNLDQTSGCTSDRIKIYGILTSSVENDPSTLCGNKGNLSMSFYHDVVHVHLFLYGTSNNSQPVEFRVSFMNCGGVVNNREGIITSPGYPLAYDINLDCRWLIVGGDGKLLNITLTFSDIEYHPYCIYDRLVIKNGPSNISPIARTYCNTTDDISSTYRTLTSSSRWVMVQFVTDHSRSHGGFRLEYNQIGDACGYVDQGDNGTIVSPKFPSNYPNNQFCEWEIVVVAGFHIQIKFNNFDIQQSENCMKDFLMFEQLKTSTGRALVEWYPLGNVSCGYDVPLTSLVSDTEHVKMTFKTDASTSGTGFNISWTSVCGAKYTSQSGYVMTPYYPRTYEANMHCVYTISPPEPGILYTVLEFKTFELEAFSEERCLDSVEIVEMFTNTTVAKLCGPTLPDPISTKGPMQIIFKSDESKNFNGFIATYRVSECGGEINIKDEPQFRSASIKSPTFPAKYQNNMDCIWRITAPPNKILNFKFLNMTMEPHVKCDYDYVELRDGEDENATLISKFCGSTAPSRFYKSSGNNLVVRFFSDASITHNIGFFGVVTSTLGPKAGCGGVINVTNNPVKISSPLNSTRYGRQLSCDWFIVAPRNKVIQLNVTRFEVENISRSGKCFDYLEVFDGLFENLVGKYCGSLQPWQFLSSSNQLHLHFLTDISIELGGFDLWLSTSNAICGETIEVTDSVRSVEQSLTVPNPYFRCRWKFNAPPQRKVSVNVIDLQFPGTPQCPNGYLEFSDVPKLPHRSQQRECGTGPGYEFISSGSSMLMTAVYGNNQVSADLIYGFNISVQALQECNRIINVDGTKKFGGRLTSPNYPDRYTNNLTCTTQLNAPEGYTISIYFTNFTLEGSSPSNPQIICMYDSLTISEERSSKAYCDKVLPPTYKSTSNKVKLVFKTDNNIAFAGYDLSFTVTNQGCGGSLFAEKGTITSPNYPEPYPDNIQCIWLLRVAAGSRLKFTITALSLSASSLRMIPSDYDDEENDNLMVLPTNDQDSTNPVCNEQSDRLVIKKTVDDDEPSLYTLCSVDNLPFEQILDGYQMAVRFYSTTTDGERGIGFRLTFEGVFVESV